ncbi:MAG: glycosyltransferase family 4 protein [Candidatus Eiseniibacteriota bacterium]
MSTEYPPMQGGVGRYSKKLVDALRDEGVDVLVICNEDGAGDLKGISPYNKNNSQILLRLVKEIKPDLIHVQYEHGLYGIHLNPLRPGKTGTNIEQFYEECEVPIITTFHSAYTLKQWLKLVVPLKSKKLGGVETCLRIVYDYWTHLLNYRSFGLLNRRKIGPKRAGIVFSKYLARLIPGSHLIYHGAEPAVNPPMEKSDARSMFSLPVDKKIALATGFMTATKGWDIIRKMKLPEGWKIVINTSRNHYNIEKSKLQLDNRDIINLNKGFLTEKELSALFYSADALILPYKVSSGSGVMYDGLAHSLPFISSNIEFFKEFSELGLGISANRNPIEFSKDLVKLDLDYQIYKKAVSKFSKLLSWKEVAFKHIDVYNSVLGTPDSTLLKKNIIL